MHTGFHKLDCTLVVAGLLGYLVLDVLEPLWEEVLFDTPVAIVDIAASLLHMFWKILWKIPGWRSEGLAIVDTVSIECCCACAWCNSWGQTAFTWLGPICGVAFVTSCDTLGHTCKYLQRCAMSAADILDRHNSIHTYAQQRVWGSVLPPWHCLKGIFLRIRQEVTHKASVQKHDQQPETDAAARLPFKIKLQPVRVLRFLRSNQDKLATALHLAENPQASTSVHPAATKHESAALRGNDGQSDLLKAHRGSSADPVPHRAASNGPAAVPDQAANGDFKLNKRARREAKKAAKAAAAVIEGEADIAPVMLAAHQEDDAEVEAEAVTAVTPASPARGAPRVAANLKAQDVAAAKGPAWEEVHHKQDRRSSKQPVAGVLTELLSTIIMHVLAACSFMAQSIWVVSGHQQFASSSL